MEKSSANKENGEIDFSTDTKTNFDPIKNFKLTNISEERLSAVLAEAEDYLTQGLSSAAVDLLFNILAKHKFTPNRRAEVRGVLSYAYETLGRYDESLNIIAEYIYEEFLSELNDDERVKTQTQLAIALANKSDAPKAVTILKKNLVEAENLNKSDLIGNIYIALARVYRKLHEFAIARDSAQNALKYHREFGDWRGIAESYQMSAMCYQQEGDLEKALTNFQLAINIVGERTAPFLLGKLYSDIAGTYWFLRQPQEGIKNLEKSIKFFEKTEHKIQSVAAYNNLGINLMLLGEWARAEVIIQKSLDLAVEIDHAHIAGILDSLGELKFLKGEFREAQELVKEGVKIAEEKHSKWNKIQNLRKLARTCLVIGEIDSAEEIVKSNSRTLRIR